MKTQFNKIFNIIIVISIAIFCFAITPKELQNDTYYTIKIGEHIMQNGVDMVEPFSWHQNLKYTYPHWLYDVSTYLIFNIGGFDAIYIATAILSIILGLTIFFTNYKLNKNKIVSFVLTLLVMYFAKGFIAARAQLVTFILFVLTILFIEKFLETKKKRYGIFLFIISVLIANIHCAVWPFFFVLFLPYIGEYLLLTLFDADIFVRSNILVEKILYKTIKNNKKKEKIQQDIMQHEELINKIKLKRQEKRKNSYKIIIDKNSSVKYLIIIAIICALGGLITPIGDTPYTYLIKTMSGNTTQNINEHLPIVLGDQIDVLAIISIIIAMLMFTKIKIKLRDLLLIGGLTLLSILSRRQVSLLLMLGSFVFCKLVCEFLEIYLKEELKSISKYVSTILGEALILALIIFIECNLYKDKTNTKYINESVYPVQACDYILENIDLKNAKFYNEYNYGSYMLYRNIPVFIDSRADLYSPEFNEGTDIFSDFLNISNIGYHYESKFQEYGITHLIMYKNAKINFFIAKDKNYKEIYADSNFVIYERLNNG